jgi:hypothetical protein
MRKALRLAVIFGAVAALLILTSGFVTAQEKEQVIVIKVGKKGDIHVSEPTAVGDVVLKPGHYQLQHRVANEEHYIDFTELKHVGQRQEHYANSGVIDAAHPGGAKCRLEPLGKKSEQTKIYMDTSSGQRRITRIEISGENVAHLF